MTEPKRMISSDEAWLLHEEDPRFLEDTEIPYRKEAIKHAEWMLKIAQARLIYLKERKGHDTSTLPNT